MSEALENDITKATKSEIKNKPEFTTRLVTLPKSKIKVSIPDDWHISDTQAAQRLSKGEPGRLQLVLIQRVCRFNGEQWTLTQIEDEIKGKDWMFLLGEFYGDDGDEEESGKA